MSANARLDGLLGELALAQLEQDAVYAAHPIVHAGERDPYLSRENPRAFKEASSRAYRRYERAVREITRYALELKGATSKLIENADVGDNIARTR